MSIVVRHGQAIAEPRSRLLRFDRQVTGAGTAAFVGTEPEGQDPRLDPRHELARLALDLVVRTAEPVDLPARWTTYPFGQEVDRTRAQLEPIGSRAALLGSFEREASIAVTRGAVETGQPAGPVRVAYGIRWLELGDGRARPAWASIVAGPVDIVAGAIAERGIAIEGQPAGAPHQPVDQRKGDITT